MNKVEKKIRFVQITDLHLFAEIDKKFNGITTSKSFQNVLSDMQKLSPQPDLVLFTGDITEDRKKETYLLFNHLIKDLAIPSYWIPGNHDNVGIMDKLESEMHVNKEKSFQQNGVQFILLDSVVEGSSHGFLTSKTLSFLDSELKKSSNTPCIIAVHHHSLLTPTEWINKISIQNADEFFKIIDQYSHIKAVISGHIHYEMAKVRNNVWFFSTPATSFQIKLGNSINEFEVDDKMPGYRIIEIDEKGNIDTEVRRVPHPEKAYKDGGYE